MATKTEESLHELELKIVVLQELVSGLGGKLEDADILELHKKMAVVENSLHELKAREERTETRRWQTVLLFGGSLLTLLVQVVILFLKK